MRIPWPTLLAVLVLLPVAGLAILMGIYPYHPKSTFGWLLLLVLAVPLVFALEFLGGKALNAAFVARMSKGGRLAYGVVVLGLAVCASMAVFVLAGPYLSSWGS